LFDYVIKEIKKIDVFKNIQKEVILKGISRLKKKIEIIKIESSKNKSFEFIIENLFKIEDFKVEITRSKELLRIYGKNI
jgi:molecular chaperone DnaK (HSP70)